MSAVTDRPLSAGLWYTNTDIRIVHESSNDDGLVGMGADATFEDNFEGTCRAWTKAIGAGTQLHNAGKLRAIVTRTFQVDAWVPCNVGDVVIYNGRSWAIEMITEPTDVDLFGLGTVIDDGQILSCSRVK